MDKVTAVLAPPQMQRQLQWLAERIRQPQEGIADQYVHSVRTNVEGVLACAFPLSQGYWAEIDRLQLIEGFVAHHGAAEPEFHHIATEFVCYVQQLHGEGKLNWPKQRLALLEYEWACLGVEIDEARVPHPAADEEVNSASRLMLNPTLKLLSLPFTIRNCGVIATRQQQHFYALFRAPDHQVVTQLLREVDVALIQLLEGSEGVTQAQFNQQVQPYRSDFDVLEWARHFHELGLLCIQYQGETP